MVLIFSQKADDNLASLVKAVDEVQKNNAKLGTVVVGESRTFQGGIDWLRECGVGVIDLDSEQCYQLLGWFIAAHPDVWNEDIGE